MKSNERIFFDLQQFEGKSALMGIDEAGRGPLAGPVVVGAVSINQTFLANYEKYPWLCEINDSKKLSPKKRELLFQNLCEFRKKNLIRFTAFAVNNEKIDQINILQATTLAMNIAAQRLWNDNSKIIIDGNPVKFFKYTHTGIIKGDSKSCCIGMASIIAKVTRDRIMDFFDKKYPQYNFSQNKAYGTKQHTDALTKYGLSPIHRVTFCQKYT